MYFVLQGVCSQLEHSVVSLVTSLREYPTIRYSSDDCEHHEDLAQVVSMKLDKLKALDSELGRGTSHLIILGRGFDPRSPLLHEVTVQAMAADLTVVSTTVAPAFSQRCHHRRTAADAIAAATTVAAAVAATAAAAATVVAAHRAAAS